MKNEAMHNIKIYYFSNLKCFIYNLFNLKNFDSL